MGQKDGNAKEKDWSVNHHVQLKSWLPGRNYYDFGLPSRENWFNALLPLQSGKNHLELKAASL